MCSLQIIGPDGGCESIPDRVCHGQYFLFGIERGECDHGSEYLFLIGAAEVVEAFDNCGFEEISIGASATEFYFVAAGEYGAAFFFGEQNV